MEDNGKTDHKRNEACGRDCGSDEGVKHGRQGQD